MKRTVRFGLISLLAMISFGACDTPPKAPPPEETPSVRSDFRPEPRDLALILDTSGSMRGNDPNRMAIYATKIFSDLLEPQDRLYVIPFPGREIAADDRGPTSNRKAPVRFDGWCDAQAGVFGPLAAGELKAQVEAIAYDCPFTVFREPLGKALRQVCRPEARGSRAVVFFSDGDTDRFNDARPHPESHTEEVAALSGRSAELAEKGVRFFGITLGKARHDQFDPLAAATDGDTLQVDRPEDLADRFATVFSRILETRAEPVQFSRGKVETLRVRRHVKELIFLVPNGGPETHLKFQEPRQSALNVLSEGRTLDTADPRASNPEQCGEIGICRTDDQSTGAGGEVNRYTILRVSQPREGEWRASVTKSPLATVKAILIQNYDLYLEVLGEQQREGWVGEANRFEARLVNGRGEIIQDEEVFAGAKYQFSVYDTAGVPLIQRQVKPDAKYRMIHDYIPASDAPVSIRVTLTNEDWLTRRVYLTFKGVKDIELHQAAPAAFGQQVPWTDAFIETLGAGANLLGRVWEPGTRRTCAWVDFRGSARQARGVNFLLDNAAIREQHGAWVTNEDGEEMLTLEGRGDECRARVCLHSERSSPGGDIGLAAIPIRSSTGKEVTGTTSLAVSGSVKRLPRVWGYMPFWLPLELYIAMKLLKGVAYWFFFGFSYRDRLQEIAVTRVGDRKTSTYWPYRIRFLPAVLSFPYYLAIRALSFPYYLGKSLVNFLLVAKVIATWNYPPTALTIKRFLRKNGDGGARPLKPRDKRRLILRAFLMDGLLVSIYFGGTWRPRQAGGRIIMARLWSGRYIAETDERGRPRSLWARRGTPIKKVQQLSRRDSASWTYRLLK